MYFKDIEQIVRGCITSGIRNGFKRSSIYRQALKSSRVEKVRLRKDRTPSKTPHVFQRCNHCKKLFKKSEIQVDHVKPVQPINRLLGTMSLNEYCRNTFQSIVQVLCKPCHKVKSKSENALRRKLKSSNKD